MKTTIHLGLAAAIGALMVTGAHANTITLGYGTTTGAPRSGNGGEFVVTGGDANGIAWVNSALANYAPEAIDIGRLETFCLEVNEVFSPGATYNFAISPAAIKGGNAVSDVISVGTAYLYGLFAKGLLDDLVSSYSYTNSISARDLQNTIWYLEYETNIVNPTTFDSLLIAEFGSVANAMSDNATSASYGLVNAASFGVAALNLGPATNNYPIQDQVIYQGGGFQELPDGGTTLMLLGLSMGGLTFLKRKFA